MIFSFLQAARYKKEDDQISLEELQKGIKGWADEQDIKNKRGPDEVWAKIEKYGWLSTISHRVGFTELEDVIKYDDDEKLSDQQTDGNEQISMSIVDEAVTTPILIVGETESFLASDLSKDISERTSEMIIDHDNLRTPNILTVDESLRTPNVVLQENVS